MKAFNQYTYWQWLQGKGKITVGSDGLPYKVFKPYEEVVKVKKETNLLIK